MDGWIFTFQLHLLRKYGWDQSYRSIFVRVNNSSFSGGHVCSLSVISLKKNNVAGLEKCPKSAPFSDGLIKLIFYFGTQSFPKLPQVFTGLKRLYSSIKSWIQPFLGTLHEFWLYIWEFYTKSCNPCINRLLYKKA